MSDTHLIQKSLAKYGIPVFDKPNQAYDGKPTSATIHQVKGVKNKVDIRIWYVNVSEEPARTLSKQIVDNFEGYLPVHMDLFTRQDRNSWYAVIRLVKMEG